MPLFSPSNVNKFITRTLLPLERIVLGLIGCLQLKPNRGQVQVVQDSNDKVTIKDDVFQLDELVDPYQDALSTDLEEYSNFHVVKNNFVDVDIKELNDVLRTNEHIEVDEDDDIDEFIVEDCDGDDKIKEEESNSD